MKFEIIESHGAYSTSEGGIRERIRWTVVERVEEGKPLQEVCSCGSYEKADRVKAALLAMKE